MWEIERTIENQLVTLCRVMEEGEPIPYGTVLDYWIANQRFTQFFCQQLVQCGLATIRWETPPVTYQSINRPFEFVLVSAPGLTQHADFSAFASQFDADDDSVKAFANLRGDAMLVVPRRRTADDRFGHLINFLRTADSKQVLRLWRCVGETVRQQLGPKPIWLSTAGMGVPWLHVRIDSRPKYYHYRPYADDSGELT